MESSPKPGSRFSEAARLGAKAVREAKAAAAPDAFGRPELFIVKAENRAFAWELRLFGGVLLERGAEGFTSQALARADGERALAALRATPDLPTFQRQTKPRAKLEP